MDGKLDSKYTQHHIEEGLNFYNNFKILRSQNKGLKLNRLESLEKIKLKSSDLVLNVQLDPNPSCLLNLLWHNKDCNTRPTIIGIIRRIIIFF